MYLKRDNVLKYKLIYCLSISDYFKQNPTSLFYFGLILHRVKLSQFISFAVFHVSEINKRRACTKYCFKLGENATGTYAMIKTAFSDDSSSCSRGFLVV